MGESQAKRWDTGVSREEWLERAEALIPNFRERASEADATRNVPEENIKELHASGLFRILQPRRFGGGETDYWLLVEIDAAMARGCASTAWVYSNIAIHHWMLGMWPPQAQEELWGADPDIVIGSSLAFPCGKAEAVEGGYRLQGHWPYSSGVDVSSWSIFGAMLQMGEGQPPQPRYFMVPQSDYTVIDNWQVMGLRGTGSKDVVVKETFVPEYFAANPAHWRGEGSAGSVVNPGPLYRLPAVAVFPYAINGVALGIAQSALEYYLAATRKRAGTYTGIKVADIATIQVKVAEAAALIDSAYLLMKNDCQDADRISGAGEVADMETKVRFRRNGAFAVTQCTRAVNLLFAASGAAALYDANPLQQAFRDMHAAAAHISLNWEPQAITYGKYILGLPVDNPLL